MSYLIQPNTIQPNPIQSNPIIDELLTRHTPLKILQIIHQITDEYKIRLTRLQDLYSRIAKSSDPNQILPRISNTDLELIPTIRQLICFPDSKYWYANLLTVISSELYRLSCIWEWLDDEFTELNSEDHVIIIDKLRGIYNTELLFAIRNRINSS
jgi:hypothetical protein